MIILLEYGMEFYLNEDECEKDQEFSEILRSVCYCICAGNDIGSFEKEHKNDNRQPNRSFNIVATIMQIDGCDERTALHKGIRYYENLENKTKNQMYNFLALKRASDNQKEFIKYLVYLISGNYWGSCHLDRYIYNINQ